MPLSCRHIALACLFPFSLNLSAQTTFNMDNITTNVCEGILLDSDNGQPSGQNADPYNHNENYVFTICVPGAENITLSFSAFCTEFVNDSLRIFDGPDTSSLQLGVTYSGSPSTNPGGLPGTITATSGCMTLHFVSDASIACDGWEASWMVEVEEPEEPDFLPIANPACFSSSLTVTLDRQVPCDSIYPGAFSLTGPNAPVIVNAVPLNCSGGAASSMQLTLNPAIDQSGTYNISFTSYFLDACNDLWDLTANGTFVVNDCPLDVEIIASDENICPGDCIQLEAQATGGSGNYSYTWSNGLPATAGPHNVCLSSVAGYSITVDDSGPAAEAIASKTISMLPVPVITNPSADTTVCQNFVLNLIADPPGGIWQGPGLAEDDSATGRLRAWRADLGANTYYYTDLNTGCESGVNVNVLRFWDGGWQAACIGSAPFVVRGGVPAGGYWLGPGIDSSGLFNPSAAGSYDVTYYAPNGCSGTKRVNVDSIIVQGSDTVCSTFQPYYELMFSPLGGVWTGTGIINDFWGRFDPGTAGSGLHVLTYTIAGGCSATVSLFVEDIYAGNDLIACPGQSPFTLPAGNPPGGTWSGNGIIDSVGGVYDPGVMGGNFDDTLIYSAAGCTDTLIAYVRETNIYYDTIRICEYYPAGKLEIVEPWSGMWSGPGVTSAPYPGFFDPQAAGPGAHTLYYTDNSCTDSVVIVIIQTPVIQPVAGLCANSSPINLSASPPGGFWYHYLGNAITDPIAGTFDPQMAGIGQHAVVYVTLPDSCFSYYIVEVDSMAEAELGGLDEFYCFRDTNILMDGSPDGGTYSGDGLIDSFFNPSLAGSGFHLITYAYGIGECAVSDDIAVIVGDSISAFSDFTDTSICYGDFVNLSVSAEGGAGEYDFIWSGGLNLGQFQTVNPAVASSYSVTVSDGCSDAESLTINVDVHPDISVGYETNTRLCYGAIGFANLSVTPIDSYSYRWSTAPVSTSRDLQAPVSRTYTVTVTSTTTGCSVDEDVELPGYELVRAMFLQNPGEGCVSLQDPVLEFVDLSQGITDGRWDFGDGKTESYFFGTNPRHEYSDTGRYVVTLYAEGECPDTFHLEVCVEQQPVIYAPASFTPNGDGVNDVYKIQAYGITYFEMYIFNRWGEQIWESRDPDSGWDGTHRYEYVEMGGYPYVIYYMGNRSRGKEVKKGMIIVLR